MKQVLQQRQDVAFYLKMLPLVKIHPQAYQKSKSIICEKSTMKGMEILEKAYAKKEIQEPTCDTGAVDENIMIAQRLGITGTPTLIFQDGRKVSGAMKAEQMIRMIDGKELQ